MRSIVSLIFSLVILFSGSVLADWPDDINWLAGEYDSPAQPQCIAFPISGAMGKFRGTTTANETIANALHAAVDGKNGEALGWLKAGQCHNPQAQQNIDAGGYAIILYLKYNFIAAWEHDSFGGRGQAFKKGINSLNALDRHVGNDQISSIIVPEYLEVKACEQGEGAGVCKVFQAGKHAYVGDDLNDKISYLDVH